MTTKGWLLTTALLAPAMLPAGLIAQGTPPAPGVVWQPRGAKALGRESSAKPHDQISFEPNKAYTLAELIDLAEQHNPETREAWEEAKSKADELGIARSSLYPTLTAVVLAVSLRQATLIGEYFQRQTEGVFEPVLHVEYLVFDVGGRSGEIDVAKANLLASDLVFNDTHRRIIFRVAEAYYRLLNAQGQRQAAESSLENAKAIEEDAKARLENGLATKPDELEATAARAQADFDLQAAVGAVDIARGDLATALGVDPGAAFTVQGIDQLKFPSSIADSVDQEMDRAFRQRPDLLQQLARLRAANASIKKARSEYFPTLSFKGDGGLARAYGQQDLLPGSYAEGEVWTAQLELTASQESYEAAHESYGYGVRNLLDVVSAQKALAQARSEDVSARTQLLLAVASLAFQTADLIQTQHWSPGP